MKVENQILNHWKIKRQTGDQKKIAEQSGISENAISRAFNGNASQETIDAINSFYKKK